MEEKILDEQEIVDDAPKADSKKDKKDKKSSQGELSALTVKLENAEKTVEQAKDALLRTAAEYENFRKRSAREKEDAFGHGVKHSIDALLPVLDTLELAANAQSTDEEYKKGVLMTLNQCIEAFKKLGIEEIDALDKPFDPELHCAVMQQECDKESDTVVNVLQKGYTINGKVIRHASVAVAI